MHVIPQVSITAFPATWEGYMDDCTALTIVEQPALPVELTATLELAADFAKASKSQATQAAYASDFRIFESWCRARGLSACQPPLRPCAAFKLTRHLPDAAHRRWGGGWPRSAIST